MPKMSRECLECLHSIFQVCTEMSKISAKWRDKIEEYVRPQGSLIYLLVPRAYDKLELPSWLPTKGDFLDCASMSNDNLRTGVGACSSWYSVCTFLQKNTYFSHTHNFYFHSSCGLVLNHIINFSFSFFFPVLAKQI